MARDAPPLADEDAAWHDRTADYRAAVDRACAMQEVPQVGASSDRGQLLIVLVSTLTPTASLSKPRQPAHQPSRSPCAP
jgi:hypothetical protein